MHKEKEITQHILNTAGFKELNLLQQETLQSTRQHNDLVLLSKTGSGKTIAFLLPLLLRIKTNYTGIQALILAPSRELAIQIETVFKSLKTGHKVVTCYGGHAMSIEKNSLRESPTILIGTPGRICDHLERGTIELRHTTQFILDEYDKCLELGFEDQIKFIRKSCQAVTSTTLVSATSMEVIPEYLRLTNPKTINLLDTQEEPTISFYSLAVTTKTKLNTLLNLLCTFRGEPTIVFCNFREATETLTQFLEEHNYPSIAYHGGMEQDERERALIKFRNGSHHTLVCTDLGSRGLDIPKIQHVVHFQYPQSQEAFTHRNGRTARMKANGSAYLLMNTDEENPVYLDKSYEPLNLSNSIIKPTASPWITIYFSAGKKDKVNKIDLVGFLGQKGGLKKEDIGLITVLDHSSFVALKRKNINTLLEQIRQEKVKGKKLKIGIAK
jgi:superfamily II DNA/RNA helicase